MRARYVNVMMRFSVFCRYPLDRTTGTSFPWPVDGRSPGLLERRGERRNVKQGRVWNRKHTASCPAARDRSRRRLATVVLPLPTTPETETNIFNAGLSERDAGDHTFYSVLQHAGRHSAQP